MIYNSANSTLKEVVDVSSKLDPTNILNICGPSANTFTGTFSVGRGTMNISHQAQRISLSEPEVARVSTGYENILTKPSYNKYVEQAIVLDVVIKHPTLQMANNKYCNGVIIVKLPDNTIDVITIEHFKKYGKYTAWIDTLDLYTIKQGMRLNDIDITTSSFRNNVSQLGINANIYFGNDPHIGQDAIVASQTFASKHKVAQISEQFYKFNTHIILKALYKDDNGLRGFPYIGEVWKGFEPSELDTSSLTSFLDTRLTDNTQVSAEHDTLVNDIEVFTNFTDLPDNDLSVLKFAESTSTYYKQIKNVLSKYTGDEYKLTSNALDLFIYANDVTSNRKFTDNLYIKISLVDVFNPIEIGRKIVGRYGNKGEISAIYPDENMPKFIDPDTGESKPCDLIFAPLSIPNRIIAYSVIESAITNILERTRSYLLHHKIPCNEGLEIVTDIFKILNHDYSLKFKNTYVKLNNSELNNFYEDILKNGLYITMPLLAGMSDSVQARDSILEIEKKYPEIYKPYKITYKPKWANREFKLDDAFIGSQYIYILKHDSQYAVSSSANTLCTDGQPTKKSETLGRHKTKKNAVRFGQDEIPNFAIVMSPKELVSFYCIYHTNGKLGRDLLGDIEQNNTLGVYPETWSNLVVEGFNNMLKSIGIKLTSKPILNIHDTNNREPIYDQLRNVYLHEPKVVIDYLNAIIDRYSVVRKVQLAINSLTIFDNTFKECIDDILRNVDDKLKCHIIKVLIENKLLI